MIHIILYQPEIPPNTGNIIRLCANTGFSLHLIHPLGFNMDEKSLRRAGCDYHTAAMVKEYNSIDECINYLTQNHKLNQVYAFTTKGSKNLYTAKIEVDRSKFDIKYGSTSFFDSLGDKAIDDIFILDIKLVVN